MVQGRQFPYIEPLTEREAEILNYLAEGLSNGEIAERLYIATSTVKWYVRQLNSKLDTSNREEIVEQAYTLGLLDDDDEDDCVPAKHNLPAQVTPFVGRERELDDLSALLRDPDRRLVTILAPGGMGKTSLALEAVGQEITHFKDGVFFIDLVPLGSLDDRNLANLQNFIAQLEAERSLEQCFQSMAERALEPIATYLRNLLRDLQEGVTLSEALDTLRQQAEFSEFVQVITIIENRMCETDHLNGQSSGQTDTQRTAVEDASWSNKLENAEGLIIAAIASAVNYHFQRDHRSHKQQLLQFISNKHMLLFLDNFEHTLNGASLLIQLLESAPTLTILVTSREKLNLYGETVYTLQGLAFPSWETPEEALDYDAVKLLVQAAQRARPDFKVTPDNLRFVAQICQVTGGMPLGLLLAASWLDVLTLEEIVVEIQKSADFLATEMRDIPERQRSLRAVFNSAWQRLEPAERSVFMKLSVFQGGFTRAAAETVAAAPLRVLQKLVNKSLLIQKANGHYSLHELLRQFATEQLQSSGDAETMRQAHCEYYLNLLQAHEQDLKGRAQFDALEAIEPERQNIRIAWRWAVKNRCFALIDGALEALNLFTYMRARFQLHQDLMNYARDRLPRIAGEDSERIWARVQVRCWGHIQYAPPREAGLYTASEHLKQSLDIAKQFDDPHEVAYCLLLSGYVSLFDGDYQTMLETVMDSYERFKQLGDRFYMAWALHRIGYAYRSLGQYEKALDYTQQSLELAREVGDNIAVINCLFNIGSFRITQYGDYEQGERYLVEAYELARKMNARWQVSHVANLAAIAAFCNGNFEKASAIAEREKIQLQYVGYDLDIPYNAAVLAMLESMKEDFVSADAIVNEAWKYRTVPIGYFYLHWASAVVAEGMERLDLLCYHTRQMLELASSYTGLLMLALPSAVTFHLENGNIERSVETLSFVLNHPAAATGWLDNCPLMARSREYISSMISDQDYQLAWKRGQTLDVETVTNELMSLLEQEEAPAS